MAIWYESTTTNLDESFELKMDLIHWLLTEKLCPQNAVFKTKSWKNRIILLVHAYAHKGQMENHNIDAQQQELINP